MTFSTYTHDVRQVQLAFSTTGVFFATPPATKSFDSFSVVARLSDCRGLGRTRDGTSYDPTRKMTRLDSKCSGRVESVNFA